MHKALDTTITWLHRRENWSGLSADGRNSEPAPKKIWADSKYAQLGLNGVAYQQAVAYLRALPLTLAAMGPREQGDLLGST